MSKAELMRWMMWPTALLPVALLLAACTTPAPQRPVSQLPAPAAPAPAAMVAGDQPAVCRVGPDDGPLLADRGIGGTGSPVQVADRGIGGTGIVGVITGFASVCLGGREVAFDPNLPVAVDEVPGSATDLRAGQLAAIDAAIGSDGLQARRILVRHEASGPVETVGAEGILRVAGQRVHVSKQTWGSLPPPQAGEWLAVSGLRGADDTIEATRLDRRPPGSVLVHGVLRHDSAAWRVGALEIRAPGEAGFVDGHAVTVSGRYADGVLYADMLSTDVLAENPVAYFGPSVNAFVLEGYVSASGGQLQLGRWNAGGALLGIAPTPGRAVVEFARDGDGRLRATALHAAPAGANGPSRPLGAGPAGGPLRPAPTAAPRFTPAPLPNRSISGPRGPEIPRARTNGPAGGGFGAPRTPGGEGQRGPQDGGPQGRAF